jgi:hypothetical protein
LEEESSGKKEHKKSKHKKSKKSSRDKKKKSKNVVLDHLASKDNEDGEVTENVINDEVQTEVSIKNYSSVNGVCPEAEATSPKEKQVS